MNCRLPIAFLALSLAFGCTKSEKSHSLGAEERKQRLAQYILDQPPEIPNKLDTVFENNVKLLGYSIEPKGPLRPGQKVKLTFYWQPMEKIGANYRVFTDILDASGERLMYVDSSGSPLRPRGKNPNAGLPPSTWDPNKVYVDVQTFKVPKAKTDTIQIVTGFSRKEGSMPVTAGPKDSGDRAIVGSFELAMSKDEKSKLARLRSVDVEKLEAGTKITVDGKLDEPAWATAPVLGPFVDAGSGKPNAKSPVNGSAKLLWNDTNLYVAFEVSDADITGGFPKGAKDPHLWTKDTVEIMIDPDGDGDNADYYEIQIGPQNLVFDSQYDKYNEPKTEPDGPFGHEDWSSKLKSAVVLDGTLDKADDTDKGYTVEAAIPWKSFSKAKKTPPALGDSWRMNFYAMKNNSGVAWSPILGEGNFHKASRFGSVRFTAKGWTPPEAAPAASASAAAPGASGSAAPSLASGAPAQPMPKSAASSLKVATPRPVGSAP
jgi:hypothetical protein